MPMLIYKTMVYVYLLIFGNALTKSQTMPKDKNNKLNSSKSIAHSS
jgi:hypothetical protein